MFPFYLGLPRPQGGSGHCAARRSARPCSPAGFGLPPSAALLQPLSLRRLRRLQNAESNQNINYMKTLFSALALSLFLFSACQPQAPKTEEQPATEVEANNIKAYYFPIKALEEPQVYEYVDDSTGQIDYWLYNTVYDKAGNQFLLGTNYNQKGEQQQFFRSQILADGAILKDYRFFQTDSSGKSHTSSAKIKEPVLYPFKPTQEAGQVYRFWVNFSIAPDTAVVYDIVRNRSLSKESLTFSWEGQELPAIQLDVEEFSETNDSINGGHWKMQGQRQEIYAQGLGLVYIKSISDAARQHSRLKRRLSSEEFQALFQNKNLKAQ
ncbi:hypothetical protein SGRA_2006 [Saprospira grandis str. Lewin]|uniref:Uncharacterized protein n=2 Tax=Saprospira TaxID=1007 RepID=H6L299_SAPGL|nr:hypothetical protein SGRA_2006 [Saprospira grandis str. Lewin]